VEARVHFHNSPYWISISKGWHCGTFFSVIQFSLVNYTTRTTPHIHLPIIPGMHSGLISGRSYKKHSPKLPNNKNSPVLLPHMHVLVILFVKLQTTDSQWNAVTKLVEYLKPYSKWRNKVSCFYHLTSHWTAETVYLINGRKFSKRASWRSLQRGGSRPILSYYTDLFIFGPKNTKKGGGPLCVSFE
jgi:hypothetical protein